MSPILSELENVETPRLRFRRLTQADAEVLFDIFSDDQVTRYLLSPSMATLEEAEESIRRKLDYYERGEAFQLAVEERATQTVVGTVTLFHIVAESKRAEIGYVLGKQHWGRGLMREAVEALVEVALSKLDFNRLEADIDPRNAASAKLLEHLGFQREGLLREREIAKGEVTDTAYYGLIKSDWLKRAESVPR
jgi:RimJ/RimL family protein N-acetyltransferase